MSLKDRLAPALAREREQKRQRDIAHLRFQIQGAAARIDIAEQEVVRARLYLQELYRVAREVYDMDVPVVPPKNQRVIELEEID